MNGGATLRQKDLFTRRWRKQAEPQKEVTSLHIPLVAMLRWCIRPDVIFKHCPNGEHRDPRTAAKLKAMGVLPGVADLEFHWCEWEPIINGKLRRVMHFELKAGRRDQNTSQKEYALAVKLLGDEYHIIRSIDQAITILGEHGLLKSNIEVCGKRW